MIYETFVPSLGKSVRNGECPSQLAGSCIVKKIILGGKLNRSHNFRRESGKVDEEQLSGVSEWVRING
jgi:hypothetical protein